MRQNASSDLPTTLLEPADLLVILSEFQVENHHFLVVSLDNKSSNSFLFDECTNTSKTYTEVNRFQVQDHIYAIFKTEKTATEEIDIISLLTERELQIVTLVASGYANKQVAKRLCISEWTVSTHLRRIFSKLGVDSRAAMVYRCAPIIQKLFGQSD